jgi:alkylated DNA repair dioxygenase AlkB
LAGADVVYRPDWLTRADADACLARLLLEVPYSQHRVRLFGREHPSPRLSAWIGDADALYRYSGVRHEPLPWTPTTSALREQLRERDNIDTNSVLVNRYRDGADSMGWHADDEAELGPEPVIASISLGAPRVFRFRARVAGGESLAIELEHGSLLLMRGNTQALYRHALPKTRKAIGERINLTFRSIAT